MNGGIRPSALEPAICVRVSTRLKTPVRSTLPPERSLTNFVPTHELLVSQLPALPMKLGLLQPTTKPKPASTGVSSSEMSWPQWR